ncbi:protein-tyrosine-phosphatase IBR5 isoform X1 [Populus alba x Populus x berolinensis]|nr:protein-tyrosine-phosphatase IBR5 isoform X1 [Populus alba x Populus x berolinensis]
MMMMRKRERENPCGVCGHYHKYEEGEVCGICGHRMPESTADKSPSVHLSAFPSQILPDFLFLGSYDNASRSELLKTQGITRVLNTVPACQNLYKNSFTYHCLQDDKILQFDDAIQFLEQCERDKARVLVHCMSGKNRLSVSANYVGHLYSLFILEIVSPAIVMAYLMKSRGWRLAQCYQWVKERRPSVDLTQAVHQQLHEYEQKLFGSIDNSNPALPVFPPVGAPSFSFGFPKANDPVPVPAFIGVGAPSIFTRPLEVPPQEFQFGAGHPQNISESSLGINLPNPNGGDVSMDS